MKKMNLFRCIASMMTLSLYAGDFPARTWADVVRGPQASLEKQKNPMPQQRYSWESYARCVVCKQLCSRHDRDYCDRSMLSAILAEIYAIEGVTPQHAHIRLLGNDQLKRYGLYPQFLSEQNKLTFPCLSVFFARNGRLHFGHGVSSISEKTANLHFG